MDELSITPNPLQPNGFGGVVSDDQTPAPYHTHDGVNSPELDFSPAGNNQDIQFNDNGSFGGDDNFQWDKTNSVLTFGNDTEITTLPDKWLTIDAADAD